MRTRDEHLQWCKDRALAYLNQGDVANAITSMLSDLNKHDELKGIASKMSGIGMLYAMQQDHHGARRFIEGFR